MKPFTSAPTLSNLPFPSSLGLEFLHECLKTEPEGINSALGCILRFLTNVDPVAVEIGCAD